MFTNYRRVTFLLILFSTILRVFLAYQLEFGNDEVYYWLYAKHPDFSHFDHPPMVGFFIQFFSLDLSFDSELAIRLAAIIPASLNMIVVFLIGCYLKDEKTGFIATILYNLSIYGFIISGTFILPDAPLTFFWLLSFYCLLKTLPNLPEQINANILLVAYFFIGCAIYSKYQAIYLLIGLWVYVVVFNRKWLQKWQLYVGLIFPITAILLIYYWNCQNDFISYKFHGSRVSFFSCKFNKNSFFREVFGQFAYNNPYVFIAVWVMIVAFFRRRFTFNYNYSYLFFAMSLPLILTTLYVSLSRNTLSHWSGVSYLTLLPLLAVFLSEKRVIQKNLYKGFLFMSVVLIVASFVIKNGWFLPEPTLTEPKKLSRKDALMDIYGWEQASEKVTKVLVEKNLTKLPMVSPRWYPAAHIDYYIARPNKMLVYGLGSITNIHKYYWINTTYPKLTNRVLYITDSRNFQSPKELYAKEFAKQEKVATIPITRNGVVVKYVFVYVLEN